MQGDIEIINLNPNINYDSEEDVEVETVTSNDDDSRSNDSCAVQKRKKLNLEEYKQKRAQQPAPVLINPNGTTLKLCETIPESLPPIDLPSDPRTIQKFLSQVNQPPEGELEVEPEVTAKNIFAIHPDYHEIVLVSKCTNTDISMPPNEQEQSPTKAKFLTNIVNTFKGNSSANSLFSSINEVIQKKCEEMSASSERCVNDKMEEHHGEDKVIMHLRKDRIRAQGCSVSIQTEINPLFPPLALSPALIFNRIRNNRTYRRRSSRSRSRSRSRSLSQESEYQYYHGYTSNGRSHNSAYSSSMHSSEMDSSDSDSSAYSSARSSDQGSIRRYEQTYKDYRRHRNNKEGGGNRLQDERKIIYVGEILKEDTKESLRRKFIKYGSILKISLHERDDGSLRYGFVTFADSAAAFDVIDNFVKDPSISNYDIRFGGRRKFCKQTYFDLDNGMDVEEIGINNNNSVKSKELSFEDLLKQYSKAKSAGKE